MVRSNFKETSGCPNQRHLVWNNFEKLFMEYVVCFGGTNVLFSTILRFKWWGPKSPNFLPLNFRKFRAKIEGKMRRPGKWPKGLRHRLWNRYIYIYTWIYDIYIYGSLVYAVQFWQYLYSINTCYIQIMYICLLPSMHHQQASPNTMQGHIHWALDCDTFLFLKASKHVEIEPRRVTRLGSCIFWSSPLSHGPALSETVCRRHHACVSLQRWMDIFWPCWIGVICGRMPKWRRSSNIWEPASIVQYQTIYMNIFHGGCFNPFDELQWCKLKLFRTSTVNKWKNCH